jgi:ribosomal-protein-alanine N-acetyltransferase
VSLAVADLILVRSCSAVAVEMNVPESMETARLVLRKPQPGDAPLMFAAYAQDSSVTRYLTWRPHTDISEAQDFVDSVLVRWLAQTEFFWFLFARDVGEMVGAVSARREDHGFNLGFVLAQCRWGQGLMAEAVIAVTQWAFTEPWVSRIWAACDTENHGSARALEKAGFTREGILARYIVHPNISPEPRDCYLYSRNRTI